MSGNGRGRGGNGRGRGGRGGNAQAYSGNQSTSIRTRLGPKATFVKYGGVNKSNPNPTTAKKFKYQRPPSTVTNAIVPAPQEARIKLLMKKFFNSYYEIFDQPGRPNLESRYSDDAFFSFTATYGLPDGSPDRNLLKVIEPERRVQSLFYNKTSIANSLRAFSPTEHMVSFLSFDVPYYTVNPMSVTSMQVVVSGVFKDTSATTDPLRAFTRVFLLKQVSNEPQGEPIYEIFNDLLMLQPPTPDQIKRYHHDSQIVKRLASGNSGQERSRSTILQSVMNKTRMNREGSKQLLEEQQWDEDKAMDTFNKLNATNQIPQAFFL